MKMTLFLLPLLALSACGYSAADAIAHEINNPLSIILLNSEKIRIMANQKSFDEKAIFESTDKIETTVHRMAKIIKGLKFFAQEESQDVRHNVSVQSIVDDTLMFCRRRFEENRIQLEILPIPADFSLNCNSVQISHVLLNLFNNAFEAVSTVPNGVVKLEVSGNANQIIFSITDNGKGIPAEIRDKIMQPFFTTKEIGASPGLGLSITFGIVDLYGGNLTLKPLDQGSCFVVTLPRMAIAA